MSALGHYLEEEGIATVALSLIRPQTENTGPPRALWVPFELGRPLGPPSDPAFQRRVLLAALGMLERHDGPVIIDDFPDDDPRGRPDPNWHPPALLGLGAAADVMPAEIAALRPVHQAWVARRGRTTVGLSEPPIGECAAYVANWLDGKAPASPRDVFSPPLMLRFAVDDLKAWCLEAAAATGQPSSRQLGDWLWNESATGAAIHALREACLMAEDERLRLVAGNFLVPAVRVRAA